MRVCKRADEWRRVWRFGSPRAVSDKAGRVRGGKSAKGKFFAQDLRGQFAGSERVVNAFACKWFDHSCGIAHEQQVIPESRNRFPGKRGDRAPWLIRCDFEMPLRPIASALGCHRGIADKAQVQLSPPTLQ